jgi:hypothetical protein
LAGSAGVPASGTRFSAINVYRTTRLSTKTDIKTAQSMLRRAVICTSVDIYGKVTAGHSVVSVVLRHPKP